MKMKEYYEELLLSKIKESEDEYDYMVATNNFPPKSSNLESQWENNRSKVNKGESKK